MSDTNTPERKRAYIIIEPTKVTVALFSVLIAMMGWFGKIAYDKLVSIENDVKVLLVSSGVDKAKIENLQKWQDRQDSQQGPMNKRKTTAFNFMGLEFLVPQEVELYATK